MIMKREDESMSQMELALQLDPQNQLFQWLNAVLLLATDRFDETIERANTILRTQPNNPYAWARLVQAYYAKGMFEDAYQATIRNWTVRARTDAVETLESGYEENGFTGAMFRLAEWKNQIWGVGDPFNYAAAGKTEKALDALEQLFERHDPNLPYSGMDPTRHTLHQEPRFQKMLTRLNFPDEVLVKYLEEFNEGR
jgi:tetratricopeptide (TPR) repeat protein